MYIYFIRHGESEANVLREFSNSGFKHPLTLTGITQAQALAQRLATPAKGRAIQSIYTSPVMRAVQTAAILSKALKIEMKIAEPLREWSVGILEGQRDEAGWQMHRQVQEDWFVHGKLESKIPGGESWLEIRARFIPFLQWLFAKHAPNDENIALVAHGGLYFAMLPEAFRNLPIEALERRSLPNCAYVLGETRPDGLYCLEWCGEKYP